MNQWETAGMLIDTMDNDQLQRSLAQLGAYVLIDALHNPSPINDELLRLVMPGELATIVAES